MGDTISTDQLLQDEEINAILVEAPDTTLAAAICSEAIAGKFSRLADTTVGKTSVSYSQKAKAYFDLGTKLRTQYKKSYKAVPYCGGISESDKQVDEDNTDRVKPKFEMDMMDNPGVVDTRNEYYGL
jgi:hypothetical protein